MYHQGKNIKGKTEMWLKEYFQVITINILEKLCTAKNHISNEFHLYIGDGGGIGNF